jgi:hypothetical protein
MSCTAQFWEESVQSEQAQSGYPRSRQCREFWSCFEIQRARDNVGYGLYKMCSQ